MGNIVFLPLIPFALWWPLAMAATGLMAWYAVAARQRLPRGRYWPILSLMFLSIAAPLIVLLNPTWIQRVPPAAGKSLLTVLVDTSGSMKTEDGAQGQSRYALAAVLARRVAEELGNRYDVRLRVFSDDWSTVAPETLGDREPDGTATDLAAAIEGALEEAAVQGQAVLVLSDGAHNAAGGVSAVRTAVAKAQTLAVPVFTHTLGGQATVRDLELVLNLPQELAFVRQTVPVVATIRSRGLTVDRITVTLLQDQEVVQSQEVSLPAGGTAVQTTFDVQQESPGLFRYEVRVDAMAGEVTDVNNSATLLLRVVDQPVRVLLLEGKPYWDTKFLVRTLAADPSIELNSVVRLAENRLLSRVIAHPSHANAIAADDRASAEPSDRWEIQQDAEQWLADPERLAEYRIVILGRNAEVFFGDQTVKTLKRWLVESSGSLVCSRGAPSSEINQRLGRLMPVQWNTSPESRFRVQWTEAGRALHWLPPAAGENTLAALPSLATTHRVDHTKPLTTVLATGNVAGGDPSAVIAYQPVGGGRVVVVEGAGMWRWAFLPAEHQQHDEVYGTFWRSLIRWLVSGSGLLPDQRLALVTDKVTFSTEENVTATLLLREDPGEAEIAPASVAGRSPDPPTVVILQPAGGGDSRTVTPIPMGDLVGQYQVRFGRLAESRYSARVADAPGDETGAATTFDVRGSLAEQLDVQARPDLMRYIADTSGGATLEDISPREISERFQQLLRQSRPERTIQTTAWDRWWVLAGILVFWSATWGLRRWTGLV